ncbi:MAG: transporter [Phycisphaerales bacterium]
MNGTITTIATISLVTTAILAEANLMRVLIAEQRVHRPQLFRKGSARRRVPGSDPRTSAQNSAWSLRSCLRGPRVPLVAGAIACALAPALVFAEPPAADPTPPNTPTPSVQPAPAPSGATATPTNPTDPVATAGAAQTPPAEPAPLVISADRPGFSETTSIVPALHLQIESGYTFTFRNRDGVETQRNNAPEILARFGVLDDCLELRLSTAGYVWSRSDDGTGTGFVSSEGWSDFALGVKWKVADQDGWLPRIALDATTTLGAGPDNISSQMVEPTLKFIWSYDLGLSFGDDWKGFTLGGNANVAWTSTNGRRFTQGQGSVYLNVPTFDRASAFVEYFVLGPNTKGGDAAHYIDFGGAYLLTDVLQLDGRVGFGLNKEVDNFFVGFGVSFLF